MIRRFSTQKRLANFLKNTEKDVTTTVYRGTIFELQTLECLELTAGMSLSHVGGRSDGGIDLRGHWINKTNIVVQCKNTKGGCTPEHIRQLIGTTASNDRKTIGILATVSHRHFTRDVLAQFDSSPVPLGLARVQDTTLKSLMFNTKAQRLLKDLTITTEYDTQGNETLLVNLPSKT